MLSQQPSAAEHGKNDKILVQLFGLIFDVTCTVLLLSHPVFGNLQNSIPPLLSVVFSVLRTSFTVGFSLQPYCTECAFPRLCFLPSLKSSVQFLYNVAFLETSYFFIYLYLRCCQRLKIALKNTLEVSIFSPVSLDLCLTLAVIL